MARPALSASRGIDVIDFLAGFPGRYFTLSEIARATKINVASCHAVLSALMERGYLSRPTGQRGYALGPALIAVGESALKTQGLIARARERASALQQELGITVLLTTMVGPEVLCVGAFGRAGREPDMVVGERLPLVPPVGAPFLAWSDEADIQRWIDRHEPPADPDMIAQWRRSLALTRQRGFQVTLRSIEDAAISALMAELASGRRVPEYKDAVTRLFNAHDRLMVQPETIEPDQRYDVVLIAAPLFDQTGGVLLNLCLGGFPDLLSGAEITALSERLVRTCLRLVREHPAQG